MGDGQSSQEGEVGKHTVKYFLKMNLSANANNLNQTKPDQIKDAQV